jgi:glycine/D-amino acid oxidase-like deaminating enzyme
VDVAVIGAGFAGLSIALDLLQAEPGLRVALLEANHVGYGASGRNAGLVLPLAVLPWLLPGSAGDHDPYRSQRQLHARVVAKAAELHREYPTAEVRPTSLVLIAGNRLTAAGLSWLHDTLAATGINADHWPGDQVTETCGAPARAGIVLDAWTIHPAKLATALATHFVAAGGHLHEHTQVSAVVPTSKTVAIQTKNTTIQADQAVICTGAYTNTMTVPDPPQAHPVHTYMRASPPPTTRTTQTQGGKDLFLSAPGPGMAYWRTHDQHLLFGGLDINGLTPGKAADEHPNAHHQLDRLLSRRLPAAANVPATHRWGGAMHVTPTEVPHLARSTTTDRVVYAVGFAGSGVALALTSGPLVRNLILGPPTTDQDAVALRQALQTTTIPWRSLFATIRPGAAHLLRGLIPYR